MCKDDMLYFTKGVRKGNFLDVIIKNYIPRVYRTVERLNVRYLSCEEVNIRRNDQECGVYKERRIIRKIRERKEKIRVKVRRAKIVKKRRGENRREEVKRERIKRGDTKKEKEKEKRIEE